jgi:hypothetical protein
MVFDRPTLKLLGAMAERYGRWPHEALALTPWEFNVDFAAYIAAQEE